MISGQIGSFGSRENKDKVITVTGPEMDSTVSQLLIIFVFLNDQNLVRLGQIQESFASIVIQCQIKLHCSYPTV